MPKGGETDRPSRERGSKARTEGSGEYIARSQERPAAEKPIAWPSGFQAECSSKGRLRRDRIVLWRRVVSKARLPTSSSTRRTAVCGPACTVVWEGRTSDRPPYPDCAEHVRQLEGESPFDNVMDVKS